MHCIGAYVTLKPTLATDIMAESDGDMIGRDATVFVNRKHEKLTNCGSRLSVPDKFLAGKLYCESTECFGAFTAICMTSQRQSIHSVAPSATVWPLT